MNIERITVDGLFSRFNHDLILNTDEHITIMIGPNGYGKTAILRIIDTLFNKSPASLAAFPFERLTVSFDDRTTVRVNAACTPSKSNHEPNRELTFEHIEGTVVVDSQTIQPITNPEEYGIETHTIEAVLPFLDRVGPEAWVNLRTGEVLSFNDLIDANWNELVRHYPELSLLNPDWLHNIRSSIPVHFIDTERLVTDTYNQRHHQYVRFARPMPEPRQLNRTVTRYSHDLQELINETATKYGNLSQSLDRTFPARLVHEPEIDKSDEEHLKQELIDIENKRELLTKAGLLVPTDQDWQGSGLQDVDDSKLGVLAVYAQDTKAKLAVFDDLYNRVDTLKKIVNSRFSHKYFDVKSDGFHVSTNNASLDLEMLSSGEQHELVLLYDLLFAVKPGTFILIDEPELSLHVAWQRDILDDLKDIARLSRLRMLLATHSPSIVGDRDDLVIELSGPTPQ